MVSSTRAYSAWHPGLGHVTPWTKPGSHATHFHCGIQMVSSLQRMELQEHGRVFQLCAGVDDCGG